MLRLGPDEVRRILIVRLSALGDVVHVLASLEALRQLYPRARVSWIVEPLGARLLEGHPGIDELIVIPRQRWKRQLRNPLQWPSVALDVLRSARKVRRERFDLVVDFQCGLRSAAVLLLGGGRHRIGFHYKNIRETCGALFTNHKARRLPPRMTKVEKNLSLVRELGFRGASPRGTLALRPDDVEWAREIVGGLAGRGPAIAVHPPVSRFGRIKSWPIEHFRTLIDLLRERTDARIIITWGPGERDVAESLARPKVLPEETDLLRFAALLAHVDLLVAADTGALPMAAVLGTPTVGIYGPKDAAVYAARGAGNEAVVSPAPCSPCKLRSCEHRICTALIPPERVFEAAIRALSAPSGRKTTCPVPSAGPAGSGKPGRSA